MSCLTASVLIPSLGRADKLRACLAALSAQTRGPDEVVVVWQQEDAATRDAAEQARGELACPLKVVHIADAGVVPAENAALDAASGDIVFLIDDDAIAPRDWLERHLKHYADARVGAVGGPARNHWPDGSHFPVRNREPSGKITWLGRFIGNMYDQPDAWRARMPVAADHLVGYNMSLRRRAFGRFDPHLRPYWQFFESDVCLQAASRGYRIIFDYGNVVAHHPANTAYAGGRDGNLNIKIYNPAFNACLILAKHSVRAQLPWRLLYRLLVGSVEAPGLCAYPIAVRRYGHPLRELGILGRTWRASLAGWRQGGICRLECRA